MSEVSVLGVVGSLRRGSFNRMLLQRAAQIAPDGVSLELLDGLEALPHFSQDCEGELTPAPVKEMRSRMADSDAVLVATPEYNSSVPGVLKNALDWASRPAGESVLEGKPAAVVGASPGRFGAIRAQRHVRVVLGATGADVLDRELPVARAHEAFAEDGSLADADLERDLAALLTALAESAGHEIPAEFLEAFEYSVGCQRLGAAR